ncbi:hypothetical protein TTHERM_000613650 (macronuclear) [Tetrahymena thermophila SB210]|uniref:Uncharacterized protein n=1 Tax=Tetrahymena thermophila (strain SB210) TaxID=312017 RepID=W7X8X8_TETTS|nr:hypothetical protein TTHERM_000613650 [Tetrahymena thermophila SB210]EWS75835.1 hypothetical protein TTHERM_000613650 [Tetrahymena thermophila SB210]|eukprot:XP_012651649.1 hypothetical protein TTHERM_000613650 [Tetrahymena thermophila SB210]
MKFFLSQIFKIYFISKKMICYAFQKLALFIMLFRYNLDRYFTIVNQEEKMKKKYEIIRLINNQQNQQRIKKYEIIIKRKRKTNQINQKNFNVLNQLLQLKILQYKTKKQLLLSVSFNSKNEEKISNNKK